MGSVNDPVFKKLLRWRIIDYLIISLFSLSKQIGLSTLVEVENKRSQETVVAGDAKYFPVNLARIWCLFSCSLHQRNGPKSVSICYSSLSRSTTVFVEERCVSGVSSQSDWQLFINIFLRVGFSSVDW